MNEFSAGPVAVAVRGRAHSCARVVALLVTTLLISDMAGAVGATPAGAPWPPPLEDPSATRATAHDAGPPPAKAYNVQAGFRLGLAQLRDERELILAGGPGMVFDMGWRPARFVAVGGEVSYFRYGWSHHQERFRLVDARGAETPLYLRYVRKTDFCPLLASVRLQSPWGRVRPYVQGLGGLTIFKTTVDLESVRGDEDDVIDSTKQVALSAGLEAGLDIVIARRRYRNPEHDASMLLSIGVRRMWNGPATFGLPGSLEAGTRRSSSTFHMLVLGLGGRADRP